MRPSRSARAPAPAAALSIAAFGIAALGIAIAALPAAARAGADGPDFFRVVGVAADEALTLHAGPGPGHAVIAEIPAGAAGLRNFGCRGGLSFAEWQEAGEAERAEAAAQRWCRVGHDRRVGWATSLHLAEVAGAEDAFGGGAPLPRLAGTAWTFAEIGGAAVGIDAHVAFGAEGRLSGLSGCNRMVATFEESPGRIAIGPVAGTRMACPEAQMAVEQAVHAALAAAAETAATEEILALFDADGALLARLARREPE